MEPLILWRGRNVETMTREELIQVVAEAAEMMTAQQIRHNDELGKLGGGSDD